MKPKTLFDHLNHIRCEKTPNYFDVLSEDDLKSFNKYMILLGLSMDSTCLETVLCISKYLEVLPEKQFYKVCCDLIPKNRKFIKWIKSKKYKYNHELILLLNNHFKTNSYQSIEYCDLIFDSPVGFEYVTKLCQQYGKSEKEIEILLKYE